VKRIVQGPQTWSLSHGGSPDIAHQYILYPIILHGLGILYGENDIKLLPGGRFVLFQNWGILECWSVAENKLLWTHKSSLDDVRVLQFAADVIDQGQAATILVCERCFDGSLSRPKCVPFPSSVNSTFFTLHYFYSYVEIIHLDLSTGTSRLLLLTRAPDTEVDSPFSYPKICDELAIMTIKPIQQIFVVNWKTESCLILVPSTVWHLHLVVFETHECPVEILRHCTYPWIHPRGFTRIFTR
jgi:hypothetical protein